MAKCIEKEATIADMPGAKAVSLHDIYRVIAGHSYYHGDGILAALTCIAEGKEVNPVRPADVAPVAYGRWEMRPTGMVTDTGPEYKAYCTVCNEPNKQYQPPFCPHCGAKMDGGDSE